MNAQQVATGEIGVRSHRPHTQPRTSWQMHGRSFRWTVAAYSFHAVKACALARLFGAVICFGKFELLAESNLAE